MRLQARRLAREIVRRTASESARLRHTRNQGWQYSWHHHPEYELTLILRGAGQRFIGDQVAPFADDDLVLIGPDLPHTWRSEPAPVPSEAIVIQFSADWAGAGWCQHPEMKPVQDLLRAAGAGIAFTIDLAQAVRPALLAATHVEPGPIRVANIIHILARLATADPTTRRPLAAAQATTQTDRRWQHIMAHIQAHADEPLGQRQVAARFGFTPGAFAHAFRRRTGQRFTEYLARLRLAAAAQALVASDEPIASIAFASGFGTLAAFNRRFRACYHCTPGEHRRRMRPAEV